MCGRAADHQAIAHVFTVARAAEMLGVDEDLLEEIAIEIEMEPEDGRIWVCGTDDDAITAFTTFGIENLRELLQIHRENAEHDTPVIPDPPKGP